MNFGLMLLLVGSMAGGCYAVVVDTEAVAMAYLNQYGYMEDSEMTDGMPNTYSIKERALRWFQIFVNITVTGILDAKTYEIMNMPRCGMEDMESAADMTRRKRYALGTRWDKTDLTWRIDGRTPDLPPADVDRILTDALKVWSDVSSISFTEVSGQDADILINFYRLGHGDGNDFDGEGSVLAHAYFPTTSDPIGGDAHFDEDETYSDGIASNINLFQVAAHEFGHSLGLRHSQVQDALMYPYYRGYVPNFQLHSDDIAGIQAQYGENSGQPEEMGTPSTPVDNCMTDISMVTRTQDGSTYFANGTHVFRLIGGALPAGYPRKIGDEFHGLPDNLDAALFYPGNGKTYVFKGSEYWRVTNQAVDAGYPRTIASLFPGLPSDLSSAFIWSRNGRIYFTKGDQYYRVTPRRGVDYNYPRPLSVWTGLPSTVDAAFQYSNFVTYFFSGPNYYRFDDSAFQVAADYPQSTAVWWLGCDLNELGLAATDDPVGGVTMIVPSVVAALFSALLSMHYIF